MTATNGDSGAVLHSIQYDDWQTSTVIANTLGPTMRLLWREGAQPRFEHRCDRSASNRGVIICAPSLHDNHVISGTRERPTVRASITCPDCGLHGFITDGRWADA